MYALMAKGWQRVSCHECCHAAMYLKCTAADWLPILPGKK
jgi:hypothetical protein